MNDLYKETMQQLQMSDQCADKIRKEMVHHLENTTRQKMPHSRIHKRIGIAILVVIIGLFSLTGLVYASNGSAINYIYSFFTGGGITYDESENGESKASVIIESETRAPVTIEDGKMYYIADGNRSDITHEISEDIPYIGEYIDKENNIHKFIIGGNPIENQYGYMENIFNSDGVYMGGTGWFGNKIEALPEDLSWVIKGKEILGIKW